MPLLALNTEMLLGCKIKIFDNSDTNRRTADNYTVVFLDEKENRETTQPVFACLGMNAIPYHAQAGICQHSTATLGRHLGKRISFMEMPIDCQQIIIDECQEIRKAKKK